MTYLRPVFLCILLALVACGQQAHHNMSKQRPAKTNTEKIDLKGKGMASWYGNAFRGRRTANGERFNPNALTAAHRTWPFGARVRVTNLKTGKSVIVRINDRGPYVGKRVIDLSYAAAHQIDMVQEGIAPVSMERFSLD